MLQTAGRLLAFAALVLSACAVPRAASAAEPAPIPIPKISWQLDNPFRFFTDAADTEVHRATYLALPADARLQSPVLAAEQALSKRHEDGWAATMFHDTCWNVRDNSFECKDQNYIEPTSHRVTARITDIDEAEGIGCTWLTAPNGG